MSASTLKTAKASVLLPPNRRRSPGNYSVVLGGAVEERYTVETDYGPQEIISWVLPDGVYTWVIEGVEENGETSRVTGTITLTDADTEIPELHNFAVVPQEFTPIKTPLPTMSTLAIS